jgi:hypothetical protein
MHQILILGLLKFIEFLGEGSFLLCIVYVCGKHVFLEFNYDVGCQKDDIFMLSSHAFPEPFFTCSPKAYLTA